ncbi:hypothetical protein GCM10017044_05050 [Kordiimonas sediminis]|uniref:Uncharacterized protein n=1 Tax=Kordiimonas sediminis TaxID=1735581 RepID=A0A919AKG3_9PROT|nr:hypothetical protein [Kordiimonas sediminis]GHF13950.1 hypothetical protein GCM10017044_05050 [Kordiimonas sediminis]
MALTLEGAIEQIRNSTNTGIDFLNEMRSLIVNDVDASAPAGSTVLA